MKETKDGLEIQIRINENQKQKKKLADDQFFSSLLGRYSFGSPAQRRSALDNFFVNSSSRGPQ